MLSEAIHTWSLICSHFRIMLNRLITYATILLSLLVTPIQVWAIASCEVNLAGIGSDDSAPTENKLTAILQRISNLKKRALTVEALQQLEKLNKQAFLMVVTELRRLDMAYRKGDASENPEDPLSITRKRKRFEAILKVLQADIKSQ